MKKAGQGPQENELNKRKSPQSIFLTSPINQYGIWLPYVKVGLEGVARTWYCWLEQKECPFLGLIY